MVARCPAWASRASRVTASVQANGAAEAGWPAALTCSDSEPSLVRCAASQASRADAGPCCPVEASNRAKNAVSGVQATSGVPGQLVPGRRPPLGTVSAAVLTWPPAAPRGPAPRTAARGT